mgnify:CR=1 FL=1
MINDKYRISEVAKDLNVPMKELVELLEKQFPGEKKRTTALSNEELNFVFETYTQKNQMDSLDSYYAYREESKVPQAKSKPEKEKKEQQQKLISVIREELQKDSVPANFIDITRLGLVELTRKKVYKSLREILS